jgi:hypothetical protein
VSGTAEPLGASAKRDARKGPAREAEVSTGHPGRRRIGIAAALLAFAVVVAVWFRGFRFDTWMGDDLYLWASFHGHPSFHDLFLTATGGKYRPVVTAVQWALFQLFPSSLPAWTVVNAGLELLTACLLFALVLRLARGEILVAFVAGLTFITARFSYYNVLQATGTMEALGLLLFVVILHVALTYTRKPTRWPGLTLAGLYLLISLTHERYLALFPFLVLLAVFNTRASRRARWLLIGLFCVPPVLNIVLKKVVFATSFLMGTGGQAIGFDPVQVLKFMVQGAANLVWINWGPDYLSGITVSETGPAARLVVAAIVLTLTVCVVAAVVRVARLKDRRERRAELKGFILWAVLVLSLLFMASITIRQEYRWLYAPFVVCIVYFCYQYARLPWGRVVRYAVLVGLCVAVVGADYYFRQHEGNVFFFYGERVANSARDATLGAYGQAMADKTVYVEETRDIDWILGHDLFLAPYLGLGSRKVVWVKDLGAIDRDSLDRRSTVLLRMDWATTKLVDVTDEVLGP